MKIAFEGLNVTEGKVKYNDPVVTALAEQIKPTKTTYPYFEFARGQYEQAEAIAIAKANLLDLLILDIEKLETRVSRCTDDAEKASLQSCLKKLEAEIPLCDANLGPVDLQTMRAVSAISLKPTLVLDDANTPVEQLCPALLKKAGRMYFYTSGKQEVRAWLVNAGADAVTCAAAIHSDLARGFIKAEIIKVDKLLSTHSFQAAHAAGMTSLVDRDYKIEENTVLEIRFNV